MTRTRPLAAPLAIAALLAPVLAPSARASEPGAEASSSAEPGFPETGFVQPGFPDWEALADVDVIDVLTLDDDGDVRDTPVWFVLVDGAPYLRTRASRWLANIERGSRVVVRIEGLEYEVAARVERGDAIVAAVDAASAAKYGWQETLLRAGRALRIGGEPADILRLVPKR